MDKGAHFYNCDFQVHTPRDQRWSWADNDSTWQKPLRLITIERLMPTASLKLVGGKN